MELISQPVALVGRSFGPIEECPLSFHFAIFEVSLIVGPISISEFAKTFPFAIDNSALISPILFILFDNVDSIVGILGEVGLHIH